MAETTTSRTWQVARLVLGALMGVAAAVAAGLLLPVQRSGLPTSSSMANIGYFVLFLQHVIFLAVLFAVLLPAAFPAVCVRPMLAICVGLTVGAILLVILFFRLSLDAATPDYFAKVTLMKAGAGSVVLLLVSYFIGMKNNSILARRAKPPSIKQVV